MTTSEVPDRLGNYYVYFHPQLRTDQEAEFEVGYDLSAGSFFVGRQQLLERRRTEEHAVFKDALHEYDGLVINVSVPCERLDMLVEPDGVPIDAVSVKVFQAKTTLPDETARLERLLVAEGATWSFSAEEPLLGAQYALVWTLR